MGSLRHSRLVLFFTRDVSLHKWSEIGMLSREVLLYQHLYPHLRTITFVTYGDARDLDYATQLNSIRIICNRWGLSEQWYTFLISCFYPLWWRGATILKSNQIPGAEIALKVAQRFQMKYIARCGYLPSNIVLWQDGEDSSAFQRAQQREAAVFRAADRVVVTTEVMYQTLIARYGIAREKVWIIPNYVDTQCLKPSPNSRVPRLLCFVGRLEKEKNIEALLDAIEGLEVELMVIGGGSLQGELMQRAQEKQLRVRFIGNVPHQVLASYFNRASLFILPSFIEHHPKALLEAMACGLPVIGTNVTGIRELISHRETGYLCGTSAKEIREAIGEVLSDKNLCIRLGSNARSYAVEHFALERIVKMELNLLEELSG